MGAPSGGSHHCLSGGGPISTAKSGLLGGKQTATAPPPVPRDDDLQPPSAAARAAAAAERAAKGRGGGDEFDARCVTWNIARGAEAKTPALERLLDFVKGAAFVALQETGSVDFATGSTVASTVASAGFVAFQCVRVGDATQRTCGGAVLLVRSDIQARPYEWAEASAWSSECEAASVVFDLPGGGEMIVSSVYVHATSTDLDGFQTLINSVRDNQLVLGDLNAQLPGTRDAISWMYGRRGDALLRFIERRGAMYPTPSGPTRLARSTAEDGRSLLEATGTINDHVVVGREIFMRAVRADTESMVLDLGANPSDHLPLAWSASLGIGRAQTRRWCHRVSWHRVTDEHARAFNRCFARTLRNSWDKERRRDMRVVERALLVAQGQLPSSRPRASNKGTFWTDAVRRRVDEVAEKHGEGARAEIAKACAAGRRQVLAAEAELSPDPGTCWGFIKKFFAFGRDRTLRPPLVAADGSKAATDAERAALLGAAYSSVSADFVGVKAQEQLDAVIASIPDVGASPWHPISLTELRAYVATLKTGRCADFMGLRAEHLRLLDDGSLELLRHFMDRCLKNASFPPHWRVAVVTPVAKRKRDLTLPKSWRPVSVTALLCRLCETVVRERTVHVLEQPGNRLGKSQFGFRRGVGTSLPLSGLSMFMRDGFRQEAISFKEWDALDPATPTEVPHGTSKGRECRRHSTLIVSIDGSDAFCRALPAKAVQKLLDMGCVNEARWVAALLKDRTLEVKEGTARSLPFPLKRGVPQGSVLGPLMWSLVIDDLIVSCEEVCRAPLAGCVVVPIVFADDINFVVRGFNPTSLVAQANVLLAVVNKWASANGVPMAKLQASWITGSHNAAWAMQWSAEQGEVIYSDDLKCVPSTQPIKLLGVTYDTGMTFCQHVAAIVESCERHMRLIGAAAPVLKAERIKILYEGIVLSRMLYAVDAWYPYISASQRKRLARIHYRACCLITGCHDQPHAASVCYEAGFRSFDEIARDEITKLADRMRRRSDGCASDTASEQAFGVEWVVRLFRDGVMPTACRRPVRFPSGLVRPHDAVWPNGRTPLADCPTDADEPSTEEEEDTDDDDDSSSSVGSSDADVSDGASGADTDSDVDSAADVGGEDVEAMFLRYIGRKLNVGAPFESRCGDTRKFQEYLRPLSVPHPFAPHELAPFDEFVRFFADPPGDLIRPKEPVMAWPPEQLRAFRDANAARMQELVKANGDDALFIYTDGSRHEGHGLVPEACAGAFIVCAGPSVANALERVMVPVAPIACVYTAELATMAAALRYVQDNEARLFGAGRPRKVVVVTDSKSALDSLRTTWLARIQHREQQVSRQLFELASAKTYVTMAFVFSHVGGCEGNEAVDRLAQQAAEDVGGQWADTLWHVDTTRRVLQHRHREADAAHVGASFRFKQLPAGMRCAPSDRLPRELTRDQEKLLYGARLGLFKSAGGVCPRVTDECPLCGAPALSRGGRTMLHLRECLVAHGGPALRFETFWADPAAACVQLAHAARLVESAKEPPEHRQQQQHQPRPGAATSVAAPPPQLGKPPGASTTHQHRQRKPAWCTQKSSSEDNLFARI